MTDGVVDSGATNSVAENQSAPSESRVSGPSDTAPIPTPGTQGAPDVEGKSSTPPADAAAEKPTGGEPGEDPADKPKGGFQKRIAELTRRASEAERANERLLGLLERTAPQPNGVKQPEVPADDQPPNPNQFNKYEDYLDARADWRAEQRVKTLLKEQTQQTQARQAEETFGARVAQFRSEVAKEGKSIEGFEAAQRALFTPTAEGGPEVSAVMAEFLVHEAEHKTLMVKYLGENPDEATQLSRLHPRTQLSRLARLDAQLGAKPPARVSNAPPPPPTVNGGSSPHVDLLKTDMDTYAKHWHERQAQNRR